MRDSVARISVAGVIGAAVVSGTSYIFHVLGVSPKPVWEVSAQIFLKGASALTPAGVFLGFVATIALSIATATITYLLLKWTGRDLWWLKGIIGANAFTFVNIALFMPLLGLEPGFRTMPGAHIVALVSMTLLGIVQGGILAWLMRAEAHARA